MKLSPEQRRAALKMRQGGEYIVRLVARLVEKYGITLPDISIEDMVKDLELAESLEPLQAAADIYAASLGDTILQARSECWQAATTFYTTLSRIADANLEVAAELQPAIEFFAHGPRVAKPAPAPSPAPKPTPAPAPTNGTGGSNGTNGAPTS
nr:hypothetical protein [Kofleriaceae bacterium]